MISFGKEVVSGEHERKWQEVRDMKTPKFSYTPEELAKLHQEQENAENKRVQERERRKWIRYRKMQE